ncbi:Hypothetical_protein [Hexamita inflata]|uniref:Hypothetical_protein n=1 Tax=Hexamita inflata TaxID=28002 RepID=A0AA86QTS0_9EUKA|nr:Hypothetical protein HINF_LOCUS52190 [Hexamita inflata]
MLWIIQDMFINAKCYFVISWDEAQTLSYVQDEKDETKKTNISIKNQFALGCFYKNVMVCANSPCQHLMTASLSVALLSILSAVPVNGRSITRCHYAIVTSYEDDDTKLLCVQNLITLSKDQRQLILQYAKSVLNSQNISCTCANLDQVLKQLAQIKHLSEEKIQEIIADTAQEISRNKTLIAQEWLDQINYATDSFQEIFAYIAGTHLVPGDLLMKLCKREKVESGIQYKLRDKSVLIAMQNSFQLTKNGDYKSIYNSCMLQDCGNKLKEPNLKNTYAVQCVWDKLTAQNIEKQCIIPQQQFYYACEESAREYQLQLASNDLKYATNCNTKILKQLQTQILTKNKQLQSTDDELQKETNTTFTQKSHISEQKSRIKTLLNTYSNDYEQIAKIYEKITFNNQQWQGEYAKLKIIVERKKELLEEWQIKKDYSQESASAWKNVTIMLIYIRNVLSHNNIFWKKQQMDSLDQIFIGKQFESSYSLIAQLQRECNK